MRSQTGNSSARLAASKNPVARIAPYAPMGLDPPPTSKLHLGAQFNDPVGGQAEEAGGAGGVAKQGDK